jgi:hypothetical protein
VSRKASRLTPTSRTGSRASRRSNVRLTALDLP